LTIRPDLCAKPLAPFRHQRSVRLIIFITEKGRHPPISPLCNVVGDSGGYNTGNSSHDQKLIQFRHPVKA